MSQIYFHISGAPIFFSYKLICSKKSSWFIFTFCLVFPKNSSRLEVHVGEKQRDLWLFSLCYLLMYRKRKVTLSWENMRKNVSYVLTIAQELRLLKYLPAPGKAKLLWIRSMLPALRIDQDSPPFFTSFWHFWAGHWLLTWTNAKVTIGIFFFFFWGTLLCGGLGVIEILQAITPSWESSFRMFLLGPPLRRSTYSNSHHFWNPSFLFWIGSSELLLFILPLWLIQYLFSLDVMNHTHLLRATRGSWEEGQGKKRWADSIALSLVQTVDIPQTHT